MDGLNARQRRFVEAYCGPANCVGAEAVRLAGYKAADRHVLAVTASRLLRNPHIRRAIDQYMDDNSMSASEVVARLTAIARSSIADLIAFDNDGNPYTKLTPETLEEVGPLIREIETDKVTGRVTKIRLHDSLGALRTLAKVRGLYSDAPEVKVDLSTLTDEEMIERIRARWGRLKEANNGRESLEQSPW